MFGPTCASVRIGTVVELVQFEWGSSTVEEMGEEELFPVAEPDLDTANDEASTARQLQTVRRERWQLWKRALRI